MGYTEDRDRGHSRSSSETHTLDLEMGDMRSHKEADDVDEKGPEETKNEVGTDLERHLSRKSTKRDQIAVEKYPLSDLDNNLVGWDSQDDPANPRNFTTKMKITLLALVSAITFVSPLASSIFAPGIPFVNSDFHNTSQLLGSFAVSVYVLGFALGPLFLSPLSEIYGRYIILNCANVFFCAFTLGCALAPNLGGLIGMRFLAGVGGSACLTIGTGVIADMFIAQQRGKAVSIYSLGILFGPILGPICGGFIAQRAGWRWDMWVVLIVGVLLTIALFIFNRETYHPVILSRKTQRLRKELNRPELQNIMTYNKDAAALSPLQVLQNGITRPLKMLAFSPIVLLCSLYVSFLFGLLFLLFTTITSVFIKTYGWAPEMTGLAYLGIGLGNFMGIAVVAKTSDATIIRLAKKNNGVYEPEMRLPMCVFFGLLIPISFFWYGWTSYYHVHWIVPIISLMPFGFGMMGIFAPLQTYMIDCFPQYAASAIAGMTALRCLFGAMLPLAGPKMYESMGLNWGNSMLGFLGVAFIPVPALLFKYGKVIRERYPIKF
ncbi:AraJ, Arabinose efflux permease [Pyrenophora tritici-repentis]|nr:OsmC family protein [Pyrenophora tritici-repentis]PZD05057.1 AraJ, Arabinose efflux permease [Pyrenophora tritici-repentis]PZD35617.1 AraJ, Arabinose efflux permease [Pyrenophora tritici-repentis]PZD46422.1 AraJ, Arabinose efflux permease [Pyrenophora tritici-repentis]